MKLEITLLTGLCLLLVPTTLVSGHGRLMMPPARNSMWRFGFDTLVEYNDNELWCGGQIFKDKKSQIRGKCGVCGDEFSSDQPHKEGGRFARGIIGKKYKVGQEIQVEVEITANHWGRFEMYVCPTNDPLKEATESCFEKFPLYLAGTKNEVRYGIPKVYKKWGIFRYNVRLPPYLTCSQCVLQWTYYTGVVYGVCGNGSVTTGCGGVRIFRNCADIAIVAGSQGGNYHKPSGGSKPPESPTFTYLGEDNSTFSNIISVPHFTGQETLSRPGEKPQDTGPNRPATSKPQEMEYTYRPNYLTSKPPETVLILKPERPTTSKPQEMESTQLAQESSHQYNDPPEVLPNPFRGTVCVATPIFRKLYGADDWCQQNCVLYPPKCPEKMCTCPDTCDAIGVMKGKPGAETWCQSLCIHYPYKCHPEKEDRCRCYKAVHENSVFTDYFEFRGVQNSLGNWEYSL